MFDGVKKLFMIWLRIYPDVMLTETLFLQGDWFTFLSWERVRFQPNYCCPIISIVIKNSNTYYSHFVLRCLPLRLYIISKFHRNGFTSLLRQLNHLVGVLGRFMAQLNPYLADSNLAFTIDMSHVNKNMIESMMQFSTHLKPSSNRSTYSGYLQVLKLILSFCDSVSGHLNN